MTKNQMVTARNLVRRRAARCDFRGPTWAVLALAGEARRALGSLCRGLRLGAAVGALMAGGATLAGAQTSGRVRVAARVARAEGGAEVAAAVRRVAKAPAREPSRVRVGLAVVSAVAKKPGGTSKVVVVEFLRN